MLCPLSVVGACALAAVFGFFHDESMRFLTKVDGDRERTEYSRWSGTSIAPRDISSLVFMTHGVESPRNET